MRIPIGDPGFSEFSYHHSILSALSYVLEVDVRLNIDDIVMPG